jgi:lantibiotic modifying enzyme
MGEVAGSWEDGKVNWRAQLDSTVTSNDRLLMQFCHGTAGNGYTFLGLYQRTKDAIWTN